MTLMMVVLSSCGSDSDVEKDASNSLIGWYINLKQVATTSDFDRINQAIKDHELLSSYYYDGERHNYYATRDFFFFSDGMWYSSAAHYGACRFLPENYWILVLRIIDNNTLEYLVGYLWDPAKVPNDGIIVGKVYAGKYIGNLVYVETDPLTYTYTRIDNKIVVSNGYIYTIVDGGLIEDGSSGKMSKYDPNKMN